MAHRLFPSQQTDETIFLVVREHWIFLLLRLGVIAFLFLSLLAFQVYGPSFAPFLFIDPALKIITLLTKLFTLGLVTATFLIWVLYYLNIQIITDLRVVDIDQDGLFHRRISELHIDKIEDVTSDTSGIFATIFGFGNVYVQTAGTIERFVFERVPSPDQIEKVVLDLYEKRAQAAPGLIGPRP